MSTLLIVQAPVIDPVSLAEARAQCRVGDTADDALLASLITAARLVAESWLGRALITQTLRLVADAAPTGNSVELPRPPLQSVVHIKVFDDADTATIMPAASYYTDPASAPGRVVLRAGAVWPSAQRCAGGFEVQYVAGYGAAASDVPEPIRRGLLAHIAHLYQNRGDGLERTGRPDGQAIALPEQTLMLYAPYRLLRGLA